MCNGVKWDLNCVTAHDSNKKGAKTAKNNMLIRLFRRMHLLYVSLMSDKICPFVAVTRMSLSRCCSRVHGSEYSRSDKLCAVRRSYHGFSVLNSLETVCCVLGVFLVHHMLDPRDDDDGEAQCSIDQSHH